MAHQLPNTPYFYLLDTDLKIKMASGAGPNPLARLYGEDSAPDELPGTVGALVRDLADQLDPGSRTFVKGLSIEVVRLDGTAGPHIGVFFWEDDNRG